MSTRILTLEQARLGAPQHARQRTPDVPRLPRRDGDPSWCGQRVVLRVGTRPVEFYLAGSMAAALGVTRDSLLRLERRGVVPATPFMVPGRWPGGGHQARIYPRLQVLRSAAWVESQGLLRRRLSYRSDEVRAALTEIANEEAHACRAPLPLQIAAPASA